MIIKVCGLREADNIREVAALGVDWIGMIFWPKSPRFVSMLPIRAGLLPDEAPLSPLTSLLAPKKVGVFVDPTAQDVITRVVSCGLDIVQLHGHETPTLIRNLRRTLGDGIKMMKAISVAETDDVATYKAYADCVDYFLFDTKCKTVGGSGEQFDWSVLQAYDGDVPFLLSGGIGPDDAMRVEAFHHEKCFGIDLNSRFETAPGVKDVALLRQFINDLKHP
ncbi:MAG: phosphoribosylanthranilate isomerase [Prevotella sp.]|nr:phosphoribosylanthranilate isomerase [Prevotella sp.]